MPDILSYDEWKKRTKRGPFTPRGDELKDVDDALKVYDKAKTVDNKKALREALEVWKASKGPGEAWKQSVRNTKDAVVEELDEALKPFRVASGGWTAPALPTLPVKGKVYLGRSFECANSKQRVDVELAFDRAKLLINSAYLALPLAKNATTFENRVYRTWFGAMDGARHRKVTQIVSDIHGALYRRPVLLYFRGNNATGPTDCAAETGAIAPENFFGAAWRPSAMPATLDTSYTHIFVGKAFFGSGMYGADSIAGVIIHELTHAICDTVDVDFDGQKTYGPTLCKNLATKRPDLAITNADSYEYLCESFQSRSFIPTANTLVLPPKASITLNLTVPV